MEAECWIRVALWLEVIGFGLSVLMVSVIKIERIKQVADLFATIVETLGIILLVYLLIPYIFGLFSLDEKWLFRGRWGKEALDKFSPKKPIWRRIINVFIGSVMVFVGLLIEAINY